MTDTEHSHYYYDPVSDTKNLDGKVLEKMVRDVFSLQPYDPISPQQLDYVLGMVRPSNYLLQHHTIRSKPITYNINMHDMSLARKHRPLIASGIN